MATYAEMAPIIQGTGTTKTNVETYFENLPEPSAPPAPPTITKAKVTAIADAYLVTGIEKSRGIANIASQVGLLPYQVKAVIREIDILRSAWLQAQEPIE